MSPTGANEGVIKFDLEHEHRALEPAVGEAVARLAAWRHILRRLDLIGQTPGRYDGAGYGNVSLRLGEGFVPPGRRAFLITGTQTSGQAVVGLEDFALVELCDYRRNAVRSRGLARPSSEAMTHGAIYDLDARIRAVFHVHSPDIWRQALALGLPATDPGAAYGTPEMAHEVCRQYRLGDLRPTSLLAMGGHEDGIMVFGSSPDEAGSVLVTWLARSLLQARPRLT